MKNVDLNLNTIKDFFAKLSKNLSWVFFGAFLLLLVLEVFQIKNSIDIVLNINQPPPLATAEKGVRVNFASYGLIVNRIEAAPNFVPSTNITQDPFTVPPPAGAQ